MECGILHMQAMNSAGLSAVIKLCHRAPSQGHTHTFMGLLLPICSMVSVSRKELLH